MIGHNRWRHVGPTHSHRPPNQQPLGAPWFARLAAAPERGPAGALGDGPVQAPRLRTSTPRAESRHSPSSRRRNDAGHENDGQSPGRRPYPWRSSPSPAVPWQQG